jgi:hypothetical protein
VEGRQRQPSIRQPPLLLLQDFLNWWHLLVFVEGVIYQADEDNEQTAAAGDGGAAGQPALDCSGE